MQPGLYTTTRMRSFFQFAVAGSALAFFLLAATATRAADGPLPVSLIGVPVPPVPGLTDGPDPIVIDKNKAIALGKALFWDQNVGSDGQACASCHFAAGADTRVKNQINPGQNSSQPSGQVFATLRSGGGGPNHTLTAADFPLRVTDDDVVGSAGSFGGQFAGVDPHGGANDACQRAPDAVFHRGAVGTRKVEARNAPSVINAVFNHRNFWDGRANNVFNGSSPWGPRDPEAGVWVASASGRGAVKQRLALVNSSLASQAVTPPVFNDVEMGCNGRTWADIGRKLLRRAPLQYQDVHPQDSVLGPLVRSVGGKAQPGLATTYKEMVAAAFAPRYWTLAAAAGSGRFGAPAAGGEPYNQMEANFSMFFGLAIQLYESTLVSDQSPFDLSPLDAEMHPTFSNVADPQLRESLKSGFSLFVANRCSSCHTGPAFTQAAIVTHATLLTPLPGATFGPPATPIAYGPNALGPDGAAAVQGITRFGNLLKRDYVSADQISRLTDTGFMNIGVTALADDPGVAGSDPFGQPLSYAAQYVQYLVGNGKGLIDLAVAGVRSCDFVSPLAVNSANAWPDAFNPTDGIEPDGAREGQLRNIECADPATAYIPTVAAAQAHLNDFKMYVGLDGAMKVPGLRNVELTGPYMHNGSLATLAQVAQFYFTRGNFPYGEMTHFLMSQVGSGVTSPDLVNFMKALTDERVRWQKAPFDHPQLMVIHGHMGSAASPTPGNPLGANLAQDEVMVIPAVGAKGAATALRPFLQ